MRQADATTIEMRDLYENAPCGYHSVRPDGTIARMNRTELGWLGYSRGEVVGKRRYAQAVSGRCRNEYLRAFERLHAGGESIEIETELQRKDGSTFDALLRVSALRDGDGGLSGTRASVVDITARKRAENEAHLYAARLRAISQRVVEIQEIERRRLSAELHDRIGQDLATINLNLHIIRDQLPPPQLERVASRLDDSIGLVENTVETMRDVAGALRPLMLDDYGLAVTLRAHAEQFSGRTGIRTVVQARDPVLRMSQAVEVTLFRIAQEALTNVLKHSQADAVRISLEVGRDEVCLTIADNGCGFDAQALRGHPGESLGLLIMEERLRAIGGALRIDSRRGAGTRLVATVGRQ